MSIKPTVQEIGYPSSMVSDKTESKSAMTSVEEARAIQEVQAMCTLAKRFPRDVNSCYINSMKELDRFSLAKISIFSFPRGGKTVTGPSIRLIEMIARNYTNLKYGFREISRNDGVSDCESFCWDLESNNYNSIGFQVRHIRDKKEGGKLLTDERDIYEAIANQGVRRMRKCIENSIPGDVIADCEGKARDIILKGEKSGEKPVPFEQRVRNLAIALDKEFGVTKEMIERKYKHSLAEFNNDEFIELFGIGNALKEKTAKREDFFDFVTEHATTPQAITAAKNLEAREAERLEVLAKVKSKISALLQASEGGEQSVKAIETKISISLDQVNDLPTDRLLAVMQLLRS